MAAKIDPAKLQPAQLARLLTKCGQKTGVASVRKNITAGAPTNPDGTIHLVQYTAWLAKQVA